MIAPSPSPDRVSHAFSLMELLTVMAVVSLLLGISVPAISTLSKSGKMNQSVSQLAGLYEQARQYAIAQNTYVWVAMRVSEESNNDAVSVVVMASNSGVDPSPWSDYGEVPNAEISVVGRMQTFENLQLRDAATFGRDRVPTLPISPLATAANSPSFNTANFRVYSPAAKGTMKFDRVVQFSPSGEARVSSSVTDLVEFGLNSTNGNVADEQNVAVLRVNGLTGKMTVYRP